MDPLDQRHQRFAQRRRAREAGEDLAPDTRAAGAGNAPGAGRATQMRQAPAARAALMRQPHAGHGAEGRQTPRPARRLERGHERGQAALGLAHEEGVEEGCERQRVGRPRPAAEHDRVVLAALPGVQRHAGQVEHLEDVGVGQLVLQGEAPERCVAHGGAAFEAPQRHVAGAHEAGHVGPGAVGTLGRRRRLVVDAGVEELQPGVGDPDLVDVGVRQHHAWRGVGLVSDVELAADVAPGARDAREEVGQVVSELVLTV